VIVVALLDLEIDTRKPPRETWCSLPTTVVIHIFLKAFVSGAYVANKV
jgi:hypothetical protein